VATARGPQPKLGACRRSKPEPGHVALNAFHEPTLFGLHPVVHAERPPRCGELHEPRFGIVLALFVDEADVALAGRAALRARVAEKRDKVLIILPGWFNDPGATFDDRLSSKRIVEDGNEVAFAEWHDPFPLDVIVKERPEAENLGTTIIPHLAE